MPVRNSYCTSMLYRCVLILLLSCCVDIALAEENQLPLDSAWDRLFIQSLATVHDNGEAVLNRSLGDMYRQSVAQDQQQIDGRKTHHES